MTKGQKKLSIRAMATLVGYMIGVGMFGVPYAISRSGFLVGLIYLIVLGGVILTIHLFYTDIALNTRTKHRLIGYAREHLGPWGARLTYFSSILGIIGGMLAYIIVGGDFLYALIGDFFGGTPFQYQIIFFIFISFAVLVGLRLISSIEIGMTIFLLAVMATIFVYGIPKIDFVNLLTLNQRDLFLPYGVILFAIVGINAIPEIKDVLGGRSGSMRRVVIIGTIIPIILISIFAFVVVGVSGQQTSEEAILGLSAVWGDWIIYLGALFGFFAITTSALVMLVNLKECFIYDFKLDKYLSWFFVTMAPLLVFLAGAQDFILVASFTGAIFGGVNGIIIVLMYLKIRRYKKPLHAVLQWPMIVPGAVIAIYALGAVIELFYQIKKIF